MSLDPFESPAGQRPDPQGPESAAFAAARNRWIVVVACVAYALTILLCQRIQGAPKAAFAGYPDEPSHYISGLLFHDYLASGFSMSPIRYATNYYIHVPFFAIGYWPPLFYAVEGLWMMLFGYSRSSELVFIALIVAGSSSLLFACLRVEFGNLVAFGSGLIFLFFPIVLWSSGLVMTDLLVTFLSFAAALAFARYLDSERIWPLLAFSVLAAATILTKSSGAFLVIVPLAAVLVSRKGHLLRRLSFWGSPLVVAVLCTPWFLIARHLLGVGFEKYQKPGAIATLGQFGAELLANLVWLTPIVLIGAWRLLRVPKLNTGLAAVCLVQPAAVVAFLIVAPVGNEPRYLMPALPPLLVLAMYGVRTIADWVAPTRRMLVMTGSVVLLAGSILAFAASRLDPVPVDPFRPIAEFVIARGYSSVLVPADAEGPVIAEISELEPDRLARFLVRPGKLLARANWTGTSYRAVYKTKEEVQAVFDRLPLDAVIVRMNPQVEALEHEIQLRDMVLSFPNRWHLACSFNSTSSLAQYAAYEPVKLRELSRDDLADFLGDLLTRNRRY
jgi:hypothetical protein